jgi:hypothetical protein
MGASLGHLIIFTYNLTRKEQYYTTSPLDFVASDPVIKANTVVDSWKDMLKFTQWNQTDVIVRVVMISAIDGSYYGKELEGKPYPMEKPFGYVFGDTSVGDETLGINDKRYGMVKELDNIDFTMKFGPDISNFEFDIQGVILDGKEYFFKDYKFPSGTSESTKDASQRPDSEVDARLDS